MRLRLTATENIKLSLIFPVAQPTVIWDLSKPNVKVLINKRKILKIWKTNKDHYSTAEIKQESAADLVKKAVAKQSAGMDSYELINNLIVDVGSLGIMNAH